MAYTGQLNDKYYNSGSNYNGSYQASEEMKKASGISPSGPVGTLAKTYTNNLNNVTPRSSYSREGATGMPSDVARIMDGNNSSNNSSSSGYNSNGSYGSGSSSSGSSSSSTQRAYDMDYVNSMLSQMSANREARYNQQMELLAQKEAQRQAQAEALRQAQLQAAQNAYDRGMGYLNDAYNNKMSLLGDNYNSTVDQLNNTYNNSAQKVNQDAARALHEAYLNNQMSQKNLGQVLAAQGLSGGATESTLAKMLNSYGNNRNSIENQQASSISELDNTLANNLASALQNYNNAKANADSEKMQYAMNLENALANGQISAESSYANALQGSNDDYYNLMASYLNNMSDYEFTPAQLLEIAKTVNTTQANTKNASNYAKTLAASSLADASNGGTSTTNSVTANNASYLNSLLSQLTGAK